VGSVCRVVQPEKYSARAMRAVLFGFHVSVCACCLGCYLFGACLLWWLPLSLFVWVLIYVCKTV